METILRNTETSYSYERYGLDSWKKCIKFLKSLNLNDKEVESFLKSKHMRWAADEFINEDFGNMDIACIINYYNKYPKYFRSNYIINELM